jgi:hypothetical protein
MHGYSPIIQTTAYHIIKIFIFTGEHMCFYICPVWCPVCWIPAIALRFGYSRGDPDDEDNRVEENDSWQDYLAKYTPSPYYFPIYRPPGVPGSQTWYHSLPVELHHID